MRTLIIALLSASVFLSVTSSAQTRNSWTFEPASGEYDKRHEAAFIEVGGRFYALGGRKQESTGIYDPKTQQWTVGAPPPFNIHHFQPVVHNKRIYILGAMTGKFPKEQPVSNIIIYDPAIDSWIIGDEIPSFRRRGGAGAVIHDGLIYLVSGIKLGHWDGHVPWMDSYNPQSGEWTVLADAPRPRDHFQAVVIKNKIYAAGGRRSSKATGDLFNLLVPETDIYDIKTRTWTTLPPALNIPTPRAGTSSVAVNNHLLVIGGESHNQSTAHNEVEAFDSVSQQWQTLPPLARGRHGTGAFVHKSKLWTCCGSGNRGGRPELPSLESLRINQALFK